MGPRDIYRDFWPLLVSVVERYWQCEAGRATMVGMNPFESPTSRGRDGGLALWRAFAVVIGSCVVFAIAGALIGLAMAALAPWYYRLVFDIPEGSSASLAQLGFGLGLMQGGTLGLVVGIVVVWAAAWYHSRRARFEKLD